jgi:hypothetical protein
MYLWRRLITKIELDVRTTSARNQRDRLNPKAKKRIQMISVLTLAAWTILSSPALAQVQAESDGVRAKPTPYPRTSEDGGGAALPGNPDIGLGQVDPYFVQPPTELSQFLERYDVDRAALLRYYNIPNVPVTYFISFNKPVSQVCINRLKDFYAGWKSHLGRIHFEALRPDSRIEYVIFKNLLDREQLRIDRSEQRIKEMQPLIPFAQKIVELAEPRRRMEPIIPEKAAAALDEILRDIEETRKKIETGKMTVNQIVARRVEEALPSLREALNSWFRFSYAYDPLFTWWTKDPYSRAEAALQKYSAFISEKVIGRKTGDNEEIFADPIGRNALLDELAHEMIPYTPEELIEIGRKELEWCEDELRKVSREMGFGDDWKKAFEHVKSFHMEAGKQPELVGKLALEAIEFVEGKNLITVPEFAKELWRMEMTPPERQPINPFITGGEVLRISFPTDGLSHEDKLMIMRANNIHTSRAIVHHELIPGHYLQAFMNNRYRPYRSSLFHTDFWREGWALYWELLLYDLGFPRTSEERMGMLFWRLHRCARIIFALSFHLEKMTPREAIDFLVEHVGHERFAATGEVRRPLERDRPLQPLSYMIGALQYRALRRELVESGRMTDRQFHDSILQNNYMPLEMLKALLTGQKLEADFSSSWRFYDLAGQR